uniref:Pituitary tumor-transforming gene 1 protein-interacting protein-like n=1 Tax=Phallusia mammillata TaxID=59560 RepID=A0A6F9DQP1_9ASCI|nr:pituitary tumor-transforming gene 1 protein-interacting protein-like [Phallusia mammillata]
MKNALIRLCVAALYLLLVTGSGLESSQNGNILFNGAEHNVEKRSKVADIDNCGVAKNCDDCMSRKRYRCLWCNSKSACMDYPFDHFFPQTSDCSWEDARWGVCWVDFKAMLISVSVIFGVAVIITCCCIAKCCRCLTDCCTGIKTFCCCGCCSGDTGDRSLRRLERKLEQQAKRNELALKYGTQRNHGVPYGSTGNYNNLENSSL